MLALDPQSHAQSVSHNSTHSSMSKSSWRVRRPGGLGNRAEPFQAAVALYRVKAERMPAVGVDMILEGRVSDSHGSVTASACCNFSTHRITPFATSHHLFIPHRE